MFEEKCIEYDIVHTDLEKSIDGLKKRDNYIEVQSLTENRLYNAANELSTGLDNAKNDVEGLFGKLTRLQNTEKTNQNVVSSVKSRMTRSLENIEESLQQVCIIYNPSFLLKKLKDLDLTACLPLLVSVMWFLYSLLENKTLSCQSWLNTWQS